jgi:integrase
MANSKRPRSARKPAATIRSERKAAMGLPPEFPLFPQGSGRWAKKVRGKLHYFGKVADDPKGEKALFKWLDEKDDLLAGRTPRVNGDGLTLADLCNSFLTSKLRLKEQREIAPRTFDDYKAVTDRLVVQFGKNRLVSDLAADDFEALRSSIAKCRGPVALGNEIQRVRSVFKYGYDAGLIEHPVRFGPGFKRPSKKTLRLARAANGAKMFAAPDVKRIIAAADAQLKAMVLLGINCGFGNSDCGTLPLMALDLDGGWINYHRPKTGIDRRCPLWPESVEALRAVIAKRPTPKSDADAGLVFITKYGASWSKQSLDNPVAKEFAKVVKKLGLAQKGRGFYSLRHTFRTVADESRDQPACDAVMGHARDDMASHYRERIDDSRLRAVAEHVHQWLYPKSSKSRKPK